ncbi:hypothetical protein [Pseudanabaena sp. PCC 6802]|uniref:hypothetical protein n=1 Tax=Pseudanabaena sp. PCC 6802 TaxID=118173 RepID=UPI0012E9E0F4|nr:hypothetical protein [Pseudanabaena sp. PCC 6802]
MSPQKVEKNYLPNAHFGRSFALSLAAIAILTLALPLLTPTSKVVPGNESAPIPARPITK